MANYLKVYHLPIKSFYNQAVLPIIFGSLPYLRFIFNSEKIEIVYEHSAFSTLAHEALFVGSLLGLETLFTDHSLFGFSDVSYKYFPEVHIGKYRSLHLCLAYRQGKYQNQIILICFFIFNSVKIWRS